MMKPLRLILFIITTALCLAAQASAPSSQAGQPNQPANAQAGGQTNPAAALQVYAYPNMNQTQSQQHKDEGECFQSAQTQVAQAPQNSQGTQGQQQQGKPGQGATAKGSAGGAATGAAIGAVTGNAGEGAAVGAVGGAAVGHRKKKKAQQEAQKEQQQQQQAAQTQATDNLKRAYTACMESRNYTVK
jgi:Glycine zipper